MPTQDDLRLAFQRCWHPVATADELSATAGGRGPLAVRLLGRDLVVADLGGGPVTFVDRCVHRSARLSVGVVEDDCLRCAYHGWAWASDGRCVDVPSMPGAPISGRAVVERFDTALAYGLVWVRLDASVPTPLPACTMADDPEVKVLAGDPYTWPVSAPRRIENILDLSHFAWVHDGTLGRRDEPVPPLPETERVGHEMRFLYDPPAIPNDPDPTAMIALSRYRVAMPLAVDIAFEYPDGRRRGLWFALSPVDDRTCRTFWLMGRSDDLDGDDRVHLAFQERVRDEDEAVVASQDPPEIPLEVGSELSVRTDKLSIEYRRWLVELAAAAPEGPATLADALGLARAEEPAGVL